MVLFGGFFRQSSLVFVLGAALGSGAFLHAVDPEPEIYVLSTFAGQSGGRARIDGDRATARFWTIAGMTADHEGNLFVLDRSVLRKITPEGTVTSIAGGPPGTNDGPGSIARFGPAAGNFPQHQGLAADPFGNVFVVDYHLLTIRKVSPDGMVTTFAGRPGVAGRQDGVRTEATFNRPAGICADALGNLYVTDPPFIRKIGGDGQVSTLPTTSSPYELGSPEAITIDRDGTLYVADPSGAAIVKVSTNGVVSAVTTLMGRAAALGLDSAGNIFASDYHESYIRKVSTNGTVTPFAGLRNAPGSLDGPGERARFGEIRGIAGDRLGNIFVADTGNNCIRKISPEGLVTTLVGLPGGAEDGPRRSARFVKPRGMAFDPNGNLIVADSLNHTIRKISRDGQVTTLVGTPGSPRPNLDNSPDLLNLPTDVAFDPAGNFSVSESGSSQLILRTFDTSGRETTSSPLLGRNPENVAVTSWGATYLTAGLSPGSMSQIYRGMDRFGGGHGHVDGSIETAKFQFPAGLAVDASDNLFIADFLNFVIRKIAPDGMVSTYAGQAGTRGRKDGPRSEAQFLGPGDLAFGPKGDLFVFDNGNTLRRISTNGVVNTIQLAGVFGIGAPLIVDIPGAVNGFVISTSAGNQGGIAIDAAGKIYLADQHDNTIKIAEPAVGSVSMAIVRSGDHGKVSWPAESGLILESTADFSLPGSWQKTTTDAPGGSNRFYRLRAP